MSTNPLQAGFSVVVPTKNAEQYLEECLDRLRKLNPPAHEIIVVDAGSIDQTRVIAGRFADVVLDGAGGRGGQIVRGLKRVTTEIVMVVHADTFLVPDVAGRMLSVLKEDSAILGGSVGSRFIDRGIFFRVLEQLNRFRAAVLKISFGDQVQFMRTEWALGPRGFPDLPLMEDLECALRLRSDGKVVFLDGGAEVHAGQWRHRGVRRFVFVVSILARFFLRRLQGDTDTSDLYERYYGTK